MWRHGTPHHEALLKGSSVPQAEAVVVLVGVGVPGEWVELGQIGPGGVLAFP